MFDPERAVRDRHRDLPLLGLLLHEHRQMVGLQLGQRFRAEQCRGGWLECLADPVRPVLAELGQLGKSQLSVERRLALVGELHADAVVVADGRDTVLTAIPRAQCWLGQTLQHRIPGLLVHEARQTAIGLGIHVTIWFDGQDASIVHAGVRDRQGAAVEQVNRIGRKNLGGRVQLVVRCQRPLWLAAALNIGNDRRRDGHRLMPEQRRGRSVLHARRTILGHLCDNRRGSVGAWEEDGVRAVEMGNTEH